MHALAFPRGRSWLRSSEPPLDVADDGVQDQSPSRGSSHAGCGLIASITAWPTGSWFCTLDSVIEAPVSEDAVAGPQPPVAPGLEDLEDVLGAGCRLLSNDEEPTRIAPHPGEGPADIRAAVG
jgi:hypothetical protein